MDVIKYIYVAELLSIISKRPLAVAAVTTMTLEYKPISSTHMIKNLVTMGLRINNGGFAIRSFQYCSRTIEHQKQI